MRHYLKTFHSMMFCMYWVPTLFWSPDTTERSALGGKVKRERLQCSTSVILGASVGVPPVSDGWKVRLLYKAVLVSCPGRSRVRGELFLDQLLLYGNLSRPSICALREFIMRNIKILEDPPSDRRRKPFYMCNS